jgi:hypothetical protein
VDKLEQVPILAMDPQRFGSILASDDYARLLDPIERASCELRGRVVGNIITPTSPRADAHPNAQEGTDHERLGGLRVGLRQHATNR